MLTQHCKRVAHSKMFCEICSSAPAEATMCDNVLIKCCKKLESAAFLTFIAVSGFNPCKFNFKKL